MSTLDCNEQRPLLLSPMKYITVEYVSGLIQTNTTLNFDAVFLLWSSPG